MNKALMFHMRLTVVNTVKQTFKRPLKTIGIIAAMAYFTMIPFMFKDLVVQLGLNNSGGFVLVNSAITLYLSMPTTLTYFKRNGVNFKKPDVNFMFASPISPKQVLFYGLVKQAYLKVIMQIIAIVTAIYIFNISSTMAIFYGLFSLVISSFLEYSLALIMYASESLTETHKKNIKSFVYAFLVVVSLLIAYTFYRDGLSLNTAIAIMQHPVIIMTPIFGWKLGLLNLVFVGPSVKNIVSTILYVISAAFLFVVAYKMECKGDYYEDGIKFTEQQAKLLEKKGNISFSEAFGKKQKIHKFDGELKGIGAKALFYKQVIELKRVRPLFLTWGDLIMLGLSVGAAFIFLTEPLDSGYFFMIMSFVSIYLVLFFQPNKRWRDEFTHYFMYLIPDSKWKKLWYSTLLEVLHIVAQAILLTIPAAIIVRAPLQEILGTIVVQILIKIMMTYKSLFFDGYIANKLGVNVAQLISLMLSVFLIIIPAGLLLLASFIQIEIVLASVTVYCLVLTTLFMYLCTRAFTNIENLTGK